VNYKIYEYLYVKTNDNIHADFQQRFTLRTYRNTHLISTNPLAACVLQVCSSQRSFIVGNR